jgi:hypothetical protein
LIPSDVGRCPIYLDAIDLGCHGEEEFIIGSISAFDLKA